MTVLSDKSPPGRGRGGFLKTKDKRQKTKEKQVTL
jgi:hypothetical protein